MAANMDRRTGWYLDRGINPAYVVPLVSAILAGLVWAGAVNTDQQVQKNEVQTIKKDVDTIKKEAREDRERMEQKQDKILEILRQRK